MTDTAITSDEQLLASYRQSGDRGTLEILAQRYLPRVNSLVYQMVLNEATADDLTQDVFVKVLANLDGFRAEAKFSTWLFRIAMNTTYNYLKSAGKSAAQRPAEFGDPPARDSAPDRAAIHAELDEAIRTALAKLSPKLRAAIVLTALHGMSVREAAQLEGCTSATMYWRVHQARKLLHRQLKPWLLP